MSQHVPDWDVGNDSRYSRDLPLTNKTQTARGEDDLVELLWQDGHVVMHSQTPRKTPITFNDIEQVQKPVQGQRSEQSLANSSGLIQEDDPASWFQYPVDDSIAKEFGSDFFSEMTGLIASGNDKIIKDAMEDKERFVKFGATNDANLGVGSGFDQHAIHRNKATPPRPHVIDQPPRASLFDNDAIHKFPMCSRAMNTDLNSLNGPLGKNGSGSWGKLVGQQSSVISVGSNNYRSNQIQTHVEPNNLSIDTTGVVGDGRIGFPSDRIQTNAHEAATTSSSGGSGDSIGGTGKQSGNIQNKKRKEKDVEDLECDSEDAEPDERLAKKPTQQTTSTRRSRAAEVHNLSERRRRDRINEKMKALQELIPHCNKTDKASMLDEAIEYLKSLQLQLQMMWMGSGMAPVMFSSMQQYMSAAMGMGMVYGPPLASMTNPIQLPGVPCINQRGTSAPTRNQAPIYPSPPLNAANFPLQMQNAYNNFHHMNPHPQAINSYTNWPFMMQQNHSADVSSSTPHPNAGAGASTAEDKRSG